MPYGTGTYGSETYGSSSSSSSAGYGTATYGVATYGALVGAPPAPEPGIEDAVLERIPVALELAFGLGPGVDPPADAWTDVTAYLDLTPSSTAISTSSGRDNVRAGITPGQLSTALENAAGVFNPRNPAGPFYGDLENGTPIRVVVTVDDVRHAVWTGYIDSGWPQEITSRYPVVDLTAQDIVGVMAEGEAPSSAWSALIAELEPAHRWEPGAGGWIDTVTGLAAVHTGQLAQRESSSSGPAYIDGEEEPFGQAWPEGYAVVDAPQARLDTSSNSITMLARFQFPTLADRLATTGLVADDAEVYLIHQHDETADFPAFEVLIGAYGLEVRANTSTTFRSMSTHAGEDAAKLLDGRPHTLVVHAPAEAGDLRAWLDGRELELTGVVSPWARTTQLGGLYIGGPHPSLGSVDHPQLPYSGYLDPVVVWRDFPSSELDELASSAHAAAVGAWVGQRLDQRLASIVTGMGLEAHLGELDVSGIVTQQGYRQAGAVELMQTIENTEQGRISVGGDGRLRFSSRAWAWADPISTAVQLTFSDDPTLLIAGTAEEMLEGETEIVDDPLNICNVAAVTSTNGRQQTVENAASVAKYGRRNAVQLTGLLHASDRQSRAIAEWIVLSQGTPEPEARQVSFRVEDNPDTLAPFAATVTEGTLVRIRKLELAGLLDLYAHVIRVQHSFTFTGWTVTLTLDSTRTGWNFLKWGASPWGGSAGWAF